MVRKNINIINIFNFSAVSCTFCFNTHQGELAVLTFLQFRAFLNKNVLEIAEMLKVWLVRPHVIFSLHIYIYISLSLCLCSSLFAAFIEAVNIPPPGYEEEPGAKRVMPDKAPFAFEWPANKGWNAQVRLAQRVSLEQNKDPKIWTTQPGVAAKTVESELKKLTEVKWNKKGADRNIYTRIAEKALGRALRAR